MEFLIFLLIFPFVLAGWLYGWILCKRLYMKLDLSPKRGLEKTLRTWSTMSPEERMEATIKETNEKTEWIPSPTPKEEERAMNERVFREGLIHPLPETKIDDE